VARPVRIFEYDPGWPARFEAERARVLEAVGPLVAAVEHIGSTSVPALPAKPTIDMLVALHDPARVVECVSPLEALGYAYQYVTAFGPPGWHYFSRRDVAIDLGYHIHVTQIGSSFWREHMAFRDYLRGHPEAAAEYAVLKRALAEEHGSDRIGYATAKTEFIREIVGRALAESGNG